MRTTITISEDLLKQTMQVSGKEKYSEAVVTSLQDYIALKERLSLLEKLYAHQLPHSFQKIKKARKKGTWFS